MQMLSGELIFIEGAGIILHLLLAHRSSGRKAEEIIYPSVVPRSTETLKNTWNNCIDNSSRRSPLSWGNGGASLSLIWHRALEQYKFQPTE